MVDEFGYFCLLLALCLSVYALIAALLGASQRQDRIIRSAERAVYAATVSITLAFLSLLYLLLANNFSIAHVADASNRNLPIFYKIAAIWGAHDGSMLLWVFFTALLCAIVTYQNRLRYRDMMPYVVAVLMINLSFFLALNLFFSNPFKQLVQVLADGSTQAFVPADGRGLNPLLQHWAMVIHPPILYLGFIGFVVPFAFAIAALLTKQLGDTWIRTTRRWTLLTWLLLGVGIILGGKWAYVVLGWGGYWGWDPVENSSLLPWLASTAFLHSVIVQERRGMLKTWNILLVSLTFLLGIFGTFVTRSGVVSSVHSFNESKLGTLLLAYMLIILFGTLYLVISRHSYLKGERHLDSVLSKESAFLFNNFILVLSCIAVFGGTMFPVFSERIMGTKITLDPNWFNKINVPIGLILLFLTGVGPVFAWRKTSPASLKKSFALPVLFSALIGVGLFAGGMRNFYSLVCMMLCVFVAVTIVEEFYKGSRIRVKTRGENLLSAAVTLTLKNKRRYGGYIIHLSIALMFLGFAGNAFNQQSTKRIAAGEEMSVGDYTLKMAGYREGQTPSYRYGQAILQVFKHGRPIGTLKPEQRTYKTGNQQTTTSIALQSTPKEDLYVVFSGMHEGSKAEIAAHVNPLVFWIWLGSIIMVLGSIVALIPERQGK
jgi:cytochrome c-type biogenesis protein CcmF